MDEIDLTQIQALMGEPSAELKRRVEDKLTNSIKLVEAHIKDVKIIRPVVFYDLKGHVAGQAWGKYKIKLNLDILNDPRYQEDMLNDTLPHELAHCVVSQLWPNKNKPHGSYWAYIMESILKIPATRCHQYETVAARKPRAKEFMYECNCGPHPVTSTIHRRIQAGRIYTCRRCHSQLREVW